MENKEYKELIDYLGRYMYKDLEREFKNTCEDWDFNHQYFDLEDYDELQKFLIDDDVSEELRKMITREVHEKLVREVKEEFEYDLRRSWEQYQVEMEDLARGCKGWR